MARIVAPEETFRLILVSEDSEDGESSYIGEFILHEDFVLWCDLNHIVTPAIESDGYPDLFLKFPTDEDAVLFLLVWEGCNNTF
jgi:hypothetical protein